MKDAAAAQKALETMREELKQAQQEAEEAAEMLKMKETAWEEEKARLIAERGTAAYVHTHTNIRTTCTLNEHARLVCVTRSPPLTASLPQTRCRRRRRRRRDWRSRRCASGCARCDDVTVGGARGRREGARRGRLSRRRSGDRHRRARRDGGA